MNAWKEALEFDPLSPLLASGDEALAFFTRRDLLGEDPGPVHRLWELPAVRKLLHQQQVDGSWPPHGENKHPAINYALVETWRQFNLLVTQYGFTREHPQGERAAEFIFSCQTEEGDIRGFIANQYATYYTGALFGLLLQAGYAGDPRLERGMRWLLSMRQEDGGWTVPLLTHTLDRASFYRLTSEHAPPLPLDRARPFSHNWTGMVLRAFAAHLQYRGCPEALVAADLLKSRFFQKDVYTSYQAASYWTRFDYPFWWNNLVSALDSLVLMGLPANDPEISSALDWLITHQQPDGLWLTAYDQPPGTAKPTSRTADKARWVSLAICRLFARWFG